jgi:hypothetical protein
MKWLRNRFLLLPYVALLIAFVLVGCTSKEDPNETLSVSGNHSTGNLTMVTTDTSSDGYHYLNPQLSPDGNTILFTADWWAIPTVRDPGDGAFVTNRQMLTIPLQEGLEPTTNIAEQGGVLIFLQEIALLISGRDVFFTETQDFDKGNPVWLPDTLFDGSDNTHVILFWMNMGQIGSRLFSVDISDPAFAPIEILFMEPTDANPSPLPWQHMDCTLSTNKRWLAFTRFGCAIPDSFETCTGVSIHVLDMETAGNNLGYGAETYALTSEFSRIEALKWSPSGDKLIFSGGMDVGGAGVGSGTEIFTLDVDTLALAAGAPALDDNITRLTFTSRSEGDPISGILNTGPVYSVDGSQVYFVSTRRAPTTTLHDRNIWSIPSDGRLDPEIHYFTRSDDVDPFVMSNGSLLFSSALGFPTEMLVRLEEEAYQSWVARNEEEDLGLSEVQMRELAAEEVQNIEFFEGVMSHIYTFSK